MPQRPSVSYPSYIEAHAASDAPGLARAVRVALGAWAAVVYLVYWLGQLGVR